MVTSMLLVFGHFAFTLFGSGSTYSFISAGFSKQGLLELEPLENVLLVSIPS